VEPAQIRDHAASRLSAIQPAVVPPLLALGAVALVWLSTLQTTIGAANDPLPDPTGLVGPLMDDSGELVVAWHTWGVSHPPGYPLLNATANVLTRVLGMLGVTPVAAASLVSLLCALLALWLMTRLVAPVDPSGLGMAAAVLLPAFGLLMWLYAVVAEVYAFGLLLAMVALLLAVRVGKRPTVRTACLLGLTFGLAVGHHRTLIALLPALAVAAWPARRLGRAWLGAGALAVASLAVYAYLPLTAAAGSPWIYGRSPLTLPGMLDAVLAREYQGQLLPPTTPGAIVGALVERLAFLAREMTPPAMALGLAGLVVAMTWPGARRGAAALALVVAGYLLAPVGQALLIGTHLLILLASLALGGLWGLGMAGLTARRRSLGWLGLVVTIAVAAATAATHRPQVLAYTRDPLGGRIVAAMAALDEPAPVLAEVWGPRFFALAYGKWVTGQLAAARLVDVRADLSGLPPADRLPEVIYTTQDVLHLIGSERWAERLGPAFALESAGDGIVVLRQQPRLVAPSPPATAPDRDEPDIVIDAARAWRADDGAVRVTVDWRAVRRSRQDYRVFVHVSDRNEIAEPADILGQADRRHPVYGFYPTTQWRVGQQVRDDYRVDLSRLAGSPRAPRTVAVGLYTVGDDGTFVHHVQRVLPVEDDGESR
jgi:hypothetical protein